MNCIFPELLVQIFEHCCSPSFLRFFESEVTPDSFHLRFPPWVISQVSKDWRHIAHSTASLWSTIILGESLLDMHCPYPQRALNTHGRGAAIEALQNRLRTQLAYSRDTGLNIRFEVTQKAWSAVEHEFEEEIHGVFLRLICAHHQRWKTLWIYDWSEYGELVGAMQYHLSPGTKLTQLETLVLEADPNHRSAMTLSNASFPRISEFRMSENIYLSEIPFSVAQLRKLHLEDIGNLDCILPKLQSIQWLIIDISDVSSAAWAVDQVFSLTLPSLETIELSSWVSALSAVVAPHLETLHLRRLDENDLRRRGRNGVLNFLQNCGANVTELLCSNFTFEAASNMSVQFFRTLPSIEQLNIICEDGEYDWHPSFVIGEDGKETEDESQQPADLDWEALSQGYIPRVLGFAKDLTKSLLVQRADDGVYLVFPKLRQISLDIRCQNHRLGNEDKAGVIDMLEERVSGAGGAILQSVSLRFQEHDHWDVELIERLALLARRGLSVEGVLVD